MEREKMDTVRREGKGRNQENPGSYIENVLNINTFALSKMTNM